MKKIAAFLLAALLVIPAAGCNKDSDEIIIGCIAPETGGVSVYGIAARNGTQMAFEEINAAGGILGKQVKVVVYDDKGDANEAVNAFNKLVNNDKAAAIIGAVTSTPTLSVAIEAEKAGIPMITPTGTAVEITNYGDNIYRACFLDSTQGNIMGVFAARDLGKKTAAIIYDTTNDYSTGLTSSFKEAFTANGGTIVNEQGYSEGDVDFKVQLTNILAQEPEVLYVPDYYETVASIARQCKEVGLDAILMGPDGWDGLFDVVTDTSILEGFYFTNHYTINDPNPKIQGFVSEYRTKYNMEPNAFAALGYDAAYIMKDAIERAGTTDYSAVVSALNETDANYVTGDITFDDKGNPIKPISITLISNGENTLYDLLWE